MAEIWNLSALCRCCLKDGQFTDLRTMLQDSDTNYTTLLQETYNISMDLPLLSASYAICDKCIEDLIGAHNFKVQVVECEQKFHEYCQNELATQCDLKEEVESLHEDVSDDIDNCDFGCGSIEIEVEDVKPDLTHDQKDEDGNEVIETKKESPKRPVGRPKKIKRGRKKLIPVVPKMPPIHTLYRDVQKYVKDEGDKRICTLCNYVYDKYVYSVYGKHLQEEHSINIEYKCDDCGKLFTSSRHLLTHRNLYNHPKDKKTKPKLDKQLKVEKLKPIADEHRKDQKPKPITDKHPKDQEPKLKLKLVKPRMQLTRFQCNHCPRRFYHLSQFIKHSKEHEKVYCAGCKKTFDNNDLYEKHVCMKSELYDCRYCHKKLRKEYLNRHLKLHEKQFKCRLCNLKFDNSDLYEKHECKRPEETSIEKNEPKYECDHCHKPFKKKSHLQRHIECCHTEKKILCGSCKQTVNVSDLYEHVCEGSEPIKVIQDQFFNKSKTNKSVNKIKKETEEKEDKKELFPCHNCKFKTFTYDKLVNHNIARHRTDKKYYCDICNKDFVYKRSVEYHLALIHYKTYVKKIVCEFCGLRFKDKGIYNMHRRTMHENIRAFICELCPLTFKDKKRLKLHILRHTGERPHKCDECDKAFLEWSTLKKHKQTHNKQTNERNSTHTARQFVCKMCKEIFPRNGDLLKHYNTIHRSNLPHKCDYCPKRFANGYSKNRHMNIHLGIRFTCPICKEVYIQKNNLQRHMKSVHELGTQKSYVKLKKCLECNRNYGDYEKHKKFHENPLVRCEVCKKPYTNQSVLNRHMATLHGSTKVFECKLCPKTFLRLRGYQRHFKKKHQDTDLFKKGIDSVEECSTEMDKNYLEIEIDEFKSDTVGTESKCTVRETTGTIL